MSFLSNVISAADILGAIGDKVDYFNRRVRMQSGYDYKRFADGVVADNNDTAIPKESNMKDARDGGNSQLATFLSIPQSSTAGQYHRVPNRTSIVMADEPISSENSKSIRKISLFDIITFDGFKSP